MAKKISKTPKSKTSHTPIYNFVIKGDWSRFYKNKKGEDWPLCHPDIIVEWSKKPVAFLTPEVEKEIREFTDQEFNFNPSTRKKMVPLPLLEKWKCRIDAWDDEYLQIIVSEKDIRNCQNLETFAEGDQNGCAIAGSGWLSNLTTMKPNDFIASLKSLILKKKIFLPGDFYNKKSRLSKFWLEGMDRNYLKKLTPQCLKKMSNSKDPFFIPKVTLKKV